MCANLKKWRESASLILAAKTVFSKTNKYNYKIIALKRSSKSAFMPGTYVFPGGNLCENDKSLKWLELYKKFGFTENSFAILMPHHNIPEALKNSGENNLTNDLAFRICAIRETFEECGILLCRNSKINSDINHNWASCVGGHTLLNWQQRINKDANEFLNLCTELEIYPDVWSLQLWNNWKTPPQLPLKFNTLFFLATLQQMPTVDLDKKEIQNLIWTTPDDCINLNVEGEILLPVPQFYEISRLKNFHEIENLSEFAKNRSQYGCELFWPHRVKTDDGMYGILPGDDLYPDEIDDEAKDPIFSHALQKSHIKNRVFFKTEHISQLIVENYTPKCKHSIPTCRKKYEWNE